MQKCIIIFFRNGAIMATYKAMDLYDTVKNWAEIKCAMACYDSFEIEIV